MTPSRPIVKSRRQAKLFGDSQTLAAFHEHGRHNRTMTEIARIYGICRKTVANFFRRCPEALQAYENGRAAGEKARAAFVKKIRNPPADQPPQPGEVCPTCRHTVREGEQTIVLTAAALAGARKKLEDLIDRHLAGREAGDAGTAAE